MKKYLTQIVCWFFILGMSFHMLYKCDYGSLINNSCPEWLGSFFYSIIYGAFFGVTYLLYDKTIQKTDKRLLFVFNKYVLGLFIINVFLIDYSLPTYIAFCDSYLFGWAYTILTLIIIYLYCYKK